MSDTDTFVIKFACGTDQRRIRYEPRDDGPGMWRWVEVHTGCTWRPEGVEPVQDVVLERQPEIEA